MDKVVIVECISTSMHYVHDLRLRGLEPVILEMYNDDGGKQEARRQANYLHMEKPLPTRIKALPNYQDTLELVKAQNPILVLAGSEISVAIATKLAHDLGLRSNDKSNLDKMTKKSEMHKALKDAGLRYIHGQMISNFNEAMDFYRSIDCKDVVIKPTHGAGTTGVYICSNEQQIKNAIDELLGKTGIFGDANDQVLIQECIKGTEYIVNTISCNFENYVSSIYLYRKHLVPGGAMLYDSNENILDTEVTPQIQEMMDYAKKVVRAIGIKYGPVHGEFMIDDDGPVLIEVNCRICGGDMDIDFLDMMWGHHETDLSLESYLDDDAFARRLESGYVSTGKGMYNLITVKEDIDIVDAPICRIVEDFPSFVSYTGITPNTKRHLPKTKDLYTNGGKFAFVGHDSKQVIADSKEFARICNEEYDRVYTLADE